MRKHLLITTLAALAFSAQAETKLPAIIGDHMVLQQKLANPIWGWDAPGTAVTVTFAGQTKSAKAGADGKWTVTLDPVPANAKPAAMTIKGSSTRELKNILVGEVWICSGQSNMQWSVQSSWDASASSPCRMWAHRNRSRILRALGLSAHHRRSAASALSVTSTAACCIRCSTCPSA
jgi:hypothetical protein